MQRYSIPLFDIRDEDALQVGSKAFNLMRLHRAGARVPDGFVVTAAAMERFMEDNDITRALSRLDVGGSPETLRRNARMVRSLFDDALWPADLKDEIAGMARSLAGEQRGLSFAVRSSFSGEDGSVSSFAGQMASFLNIHAGEDLANAIVRCWTSLWGQAAMAYRARRGAAEGATGGRAGAGHAAGPLVRGAVRRLPYPHPDRGADRGGAPGHHRGGQRRQRPSPADHRSHQRRNCPLRSPPGRRICDGTGIQVRHRRSFAAVHRTGQTHGPGGFRVGP